MKIRLLCALSVMFGMTVVVTPSTAFAANVIGVDITTSDAGCPALATNPGTRLGEIATANTYLRSLVTHDTSQLQAAAGVVRIENGAVTANGAKQLCSGNQGPISIEDNVIDIRELKWPVVDGDQAIAFYMLDSASPPTYVAERFQVDHGLIQHIEAVYYIDTAGQFIGPESIVTDPGGVTERLFDSDDGPAGFFAPANNQGDVSAPLPASRAIVTAAAQSYLNALVSHNAAGVPLATDAIRIENRRTVGSSAAQIRADIDASTNEVRGIENSTIYVEGDEAIAMYEIVSPAVDKVSIGGSAIWGATRFQVDNGQIDQIESICSNSELCGAYSLPLLPPS
jgi:hypothetical protein